MTITQTSGRGVIDWREFSIGAANQVQIDNAAGATLNRVMGGQLSRIDGMLSATGSVYLMNPSGVIIGREGRIATGGDFVATTRQIDPGAFMTGGTLAIAGTSDGAISNEGSIVSEAGSVMMIARAVSNRGTITASDGRVTLAAADEVLLATTDGKADGIYVAVGADRGDITQAGRIEAAAVELRAANGNIFALAGNREGLVRATGTATINGELWLTAPQGNVAVEGALQATGADGSGGRITINGRDVTLASTADISAGGTQGGEVLVGTAGYGSGTELALSTTIADGAQIAAGGPNGGGRIETSGKALSLGNAYVTAGPGGKWLIDPDDITIDTTAAASIVSSLDTGTDVLQQTTAGGTGGVGDITVDADLVWSGSGDLTLDAYRDLQVNAQIAGGGTATLLAGRDLGVSAPVSATEVTATAAGSTTIAAAGLINATAGDVTLETGAFVNQAGAGAVVASGNWRVYSGDPANDTPGGLTPDFYQYAASAGTTPATAGNGLLYSVAPSVSFTLGPVVKDYDGTTDAVLDSGNVIVTGLINGDDFTLDGSYATKDAGTGINVTATNFEANQGGIPVFGYDVATPSVSDTVGTINRAALTAAIVGNPTKTYNASTSVSLTSANFALTGLAAGETITVNSAASAAYDSADAGSRTVDATFQISSFSPGAGTTLTNYVLPTDATGAGLINPAAILISGVTVNDKVYDSTTVATLNLGGASIFGVVAGDTVSLDTSASAGVFATEDVGNAIAVTGTGFALSGADATNYTVSQPTGLAANITPASLVVSGLVANDKIYDGTTTAALNTAGVQFAGLISGDDVQASGASPAVNFATKNAAQDISVTVTGMTLSGSDAGNYDLSFSDSLVADILQRELTLDVSGMPTKVYDGTTSAVVSSSSTSLDNLVAGESITISQAADLQYASKNVGVWNLTGALTPADYQAGPNTLLSNYVLPTAAVTQGEITPAPLTIVIVNDPTKAYDGNANASLGPGNFAVNGFVAGEGADVTQTSGTYASSDAGTWTVTASLDDGDFDPDPGTMMSNYIIPSPVYGPGTITRIPLGPGVVTVDITGNPSKIYDGTTVATLTPDDYTLGGFIAGEGATITETQGTYDSKDAGFRAVLVLLDPSDFDPDPGTNLSNYTLPTQATGVGTIFQRVLTASIINNPTKIYNGTARAVVGPANYSVTGAIAGESVTVAPGAVGNYASADAGSRVITTNFTSTSNFVFGAGTLGANYVLPTTATGPGTITPAPLVVLGVTAQNKVYDQTTVAALTGSASLFGVVAGDTVLLNGGSAAGTFATANVGNGIPVSVAGYSIAGPDSANYTLSQPSGLAANITPRGLTIANVVANDKFYDGTTAATLGGTAALVGVLGGDTVLLNGTGSTASFLQANVGTDLRVNVGGYAIAGPQAGNYSLTQPSGLTADINPAVLNGAIIGNPTKAYDGTASVSLTAVNYSLTGFVPGEGGSITQSAGATYDSADAGLRTITASLVVSDFVANSGTLLSNYALPASISGPGTINQAQLIAAIIGNPTKIYDSTTAATLTSANYQLAGFVAGQSATVTETVGTYDQKNVGSRTVTATLAAGDFAAGSGTTLSNYILPTSASGAGTISPAQVQVVGVTAADKVYDGNTVASLSGGGLAGVLGSDTVNLVSSGASGTFATRNVGVDIPVTAAGYTTSGADAANYTVLQPTGLAADITQKLIALASVTKVYDATTPVPTVDSAYALSGVVSGDAVGVNAAAIDGDYIDKNVDTGKSVTIASGIALSGADAGNYTIAPSVTNALIGTITPATLTLTGVDAVNRIYNQLTSVDLDNTATALAGVLFDPAAAALDDVTLVTPYPTTGTMQNANAGLNKPVTITGFAVTGGDAPNYVLVQPDYVTVDITPKPITLTSVLKVYDGLLVLPTDPAAYGFAGILSGDVVTADASAATGGYADKNVAGSLSGGVVTGGIDVDVAGLILGGTHGANYSVADVNDAPIGVITPRALTVAIVGNPSKVYDGDDTIDTLTDANYTFNGFVLAEGASVAQPNGTFNSLNVDEANTVTASIAGLVTPDVGTALSNYIVPTVASGPGTITPAQLQVGGVIAEDKIYDGTTVAQLDNTTGPAALVGLVAADLGVVTLNTSAAAGQFASPDVGIAIDVTATGYALDGNVHGNYTLLQPQNLSADIFAKALTLIEVIRIYDGTVDLPTGTSGYILNGIVAGDDVSVDATAANATGSYADKNVASGITVSIPNLQLTGGGATNYTVSMPDPDIGTITPKDLTVTIVGDPTKGYNGLAAINTLSNANYAFTGFVTGEGVTVTQNLGGFNSPNVLDASTITATIDGFLTPDLGTLLSNYTIPTTAQGPGTITPAPVSAAIVGNPTKVYDGDTDAALTVTNYQITGFVAGQGATVSQTLGTYNSKDVLTANTVTASIGGFINADAGTLLSNYALPTTATGAGTIAAATLTAAIVGNPTKVYDGNTAADLVAANFEFTGFVAGESATITQDFGTYNSKDVPAAATITASLTGFIDPGPGTLLSNYNLPTTAQGPGTITSATLTAAIIGNPTKVYDGDTDADLATTNYQFTGFVAGEGATVTQTLGSYNSKDVLAANTVAADIVGFIDPDPVTNLANYTLPTTAEGAGSITAATLGATIIGNPTKVYDGNAIATLVPGNYQLTGFVAGEGATVTETVGAYASANAGPRIVTATLDAGDFSATGATLLSNYVTPTSASGLGTINQATLTASIVGIPTKTYDADIAIVLGPADYQLMGFVSGEGATITETAGTFASANAGLRQITATLAPADFVPTGTTLLANYLLPTSASGIGLIERALLAASVIGDPTKTYDGTDAATLASTNYQLTGFAAGQGAAVLETSGTYDSADAGPRTVTVALGSADFAANAGTSLLNYVLPTSATGPGTIDPALLAVAIIGNPTKVYDGNTAATLASGNYQLTGFIGSDGATVTETAGAYSLKDVGSRTITAILTSADYVATGGTLLDNYTLPTSASGPGAITRATLAAAIVGNPTRVYDGTTAAGLTEANYALTGFVTGEGATVTQTVGAYDGKDVGSHTVTATLGAGDFTATGGALLSNYTLPVSAAGPGAISRAPLTAAIIGNPTKTYDGETDAALTTANYQLTGFVAGEGATVTETLGMYDSPNAGSRTVGATLGASDFTATGNTLLSNYTLPVSASGAGTIDPALLTAAIIGNPTKVYDGTTAATLSSSNYSLTGFVSGEGATVTQTIGTYALKDTGLRTVSATLTAADFSAAGSTLLSNYTLPTSASGLGTITRATLTAAIIGNPTKVYDGNTTATLTSGNYGLAGFVAGEGATVTQTVGTYALKDAGLRAVTATLTAADFTATGSTLLDNYTLPTSASGFGTITRALLTAAIIGDPTKVYDGTTAATLTSVNYSLTGFVSGEGATVTQTVGTYALKDAGLRSVTATLTAADFAATGSTLLDNYTLPTSASGLGNITRAPLTASIISNPTRTYDGTTVATLTSGNYQLTGFVAGEGATVTQTVGAYDGKDVGSHNVTATLAAGDFTASGGTLLGNYTLPSGASGPGAIIRALLTAAIVGNPTKTYDGTDAAALASGNYSLTGFVAGEGASVTQTVGSYDSANAGARTVTANLAAGDFAATGVTLLSNYSLPTTASGAGTIDPALLTAAIIGNPTKVYDGTTDATLTSGNYRLTGFVSGEGATVTETAGTYGLKDAGLRTVTATLTPADFAAAGNTLLSNYTLPISASGLGTIDPALLTAAIVGNPSKVYDGNTTATLGSDNYALSGFVAGEGAWVTQTVGTYALKDAGLRAVVATLTAADLTAMGSTLLSNYTLPTSASGTGTITQAMLTATIVGDPTKVYEGNASVTLTMGNYQLSGFVTGEGATVTERIGAYDSANAGPRTVTAALGADDFVPTGDTLLSNYMLPDRASGLGTILPAPLTAEIVGNPTRVYDGTVTALLGPGNFLLRGFVAGEGATVMQTDGLYDSANAGSRTVTAGLATGGFLAAGGTLLSNYVLPTSASGPGTIDRAQLAVAITGNPTKPHDGNTDAVLVPGDYSLTGFISGEGATITQPFGTYAAPDVGEHTVTALLSATDYAADAGTLLSNYNLPTTAEGPGEITAVLPCATIRDCFGPELALSFNRSHVAHFYIVYPSAFARYQGQTNAFAGLPSIMIPASTVKTSYGWQFFTGTAIFNSSEQVLPRGGGSTAIQIYYTPPLPRIDLEEVRP